jgi:hypothetical protein
LIVPLLLFATTALNLRVGDQWTYRIEQSFLPIDVSDPNEEEERFTYQFKIEVLDRDGDGFKMESKSRLLGHRFGGENLPGTEKTPDLIEDFVLAPSGAHSFTVERYSSAPEYRLARLSWFGFPPKNLSDAWEAEWPVVGDYWANGATVSYKRIGKTERLGRTCSLFEEHFSEKGPKAMTASGRVDVDDVTGIVMALNLRAENASLPGGTEPHRLTIKLEATELKLKKRP